MRTTGGLILLAAVAVAVLLTGRSPRRASEWERVKADVRQWTADRNGYVEGLTAGRPRNADFEAVMDARMSDILARYERVRQW